MGSGGLDREDAVSRRTDLEGVSALASTRVLVVDDDDGVRGFLAATLRMDGYECVEAASGREALDLVDETIVAVVLDNRLPDIRGIDLLPQLRARVNATLPVLLVTGDDQLNGAAAGLG